jgi:hypothetical protein
MEEEDFAAGEPAPDLSAREKPESTDPVECGANQSGAI